MNFQNERGLFADRARIICECCFIGGADFAQFRATRLKDFADPKSSADLDQFASRNDHFVLLLNEMTNDQNKRGGAVVHGSGRFRLTENGERALQVSAAATAVAGGKIELQIIIRGSDVPERFACALRKRRSAEVGMNNDTSSVDYRLNAARAKLHKRGADKIDNLAELRDFTGPTELRQFASDKIDNQRTR